MADNNESTVNTAGEQEGKKQGKKKNNNGNAIQRIIKFIVKHAVAVGYISVAILIIIFIIGILQILITMPGLILGKLKEFGTKILAATEGVFNGNNIDKRITKEDENELAQYIQDMGYDIIGFGFGDVKANEEKIEDGEDDDDDSKVQIELLNGDKNYIKQYLVQNAAIYTPTVWNIKGAFESLLEEETAQDYAVGMLDITTNGKHTDTPKFSLDPISGIINSIKGIKQSLDYHVSVDAENRTLKLSKPFGETYYFDMSNWASKYGKPMELFLALHLSTMMPDLAYDLATADCFNTKVHIDFQSVEATYTVSYINEEGKTLSQEDIGNACNDLLIDEVANMSSEGTEGWDTAKIVATKLATWLISDNGRSPIKEEAIDENGKIVIGPLKGLTGKQLSQLLALILEGDTKKDMYFPRITDVTKHWYYDTIEFNYGRATEIKKQIRYEPEDKNNGLYGVQGIILNTTMTADKGVYYQLEEPELVGPNEAIISLFKGGEGNRDNVKYDFPGEYYRFDGTKERAQEIFNAKSLDKSNGKDSIYIYQGKIYKTHERTVYKEPVVFYDADNKNSYKNAYTAFAMLEKANTEEAEVSYRCLKELLVKLEYFTEDDLKNPITQVLKWFLPDIAVNDRRMRIANDANAFGMIIIGNESGSKVNAPGDAKVIKVEDDSVTLEFTELNDKVVKQLEDKIKDDKLSYIDKNSVVGLQMVISGINPTVKKGDNVKVDNEIGTSKEDNKGRIQFYFKNSEGSIIDNVTKYIDIYNENKLLED